MITLDDLFQLQEDAAKWNMELAIAAWRAEKDPGLGFSCSYGISEFDGWRGF